MNVQHTLSLDYGSLCDGQTVAGELCPACKGGSTGEGSLSVSKREGILLWKCHRDSCGFAGGEAGRRSKGEQLAAKGICRGVAGRQLERESEVVGPQARATLSAKYGIGDNLIARAGAGWDTASNRLVLPVLSYRDERLGVVLRTLSNQQPKTLNHTEKDALAWYVNPTPTFPGVIVVEDQLSAIRASTYLTSVALLGTHVNDERAAEIKASGYNPVYIALDADAWPTAVSIAIRHRGLLKPRLIRLPKDIKAHTHEELDALFAANVSSV